jgi:hypothetical protein
MSIANALDTRHGVFSVHALRPAFICDTLVSKVSIREWVTKME